MSTLPKHLHEAERLLGKGVKLVKLHQNQKRPVGDGWNQADNTTTRIDPKATGYGIPLAVNDLCSIDPDDVEKAEIGLAALGFDLETWMQAGVRTCSSRIGSGGRSAFLYEACLRWVKFSSPETGTVLELRAESANLQDCCPGVQYLDKVGNECTQDYDPFTEYTFDDAPALPEDLCNWWMRCSTDVEFLREQQTIFFDALDASAHLAVSAGDKSLAFPSTLRMSFNNNTPVESILERHGYTSHANGRWAPVTATGAPAVRLISGKKDLWHSDHASDPLFGNFDAWTAYVVLDHGGDLETAERAYQDAGLDEFTCEDDEGAVVTGFEALAIEARSVTGRDSFKAFAEKVSAVPTAMLNATDRHMLAGIVAGLKVLDGATRGTIDKAFKYAPKIVERNRPKYERNEEGFIMTTTGNILLALGCESEVRLQLAYDNFTDDLKYSTDGSNWLLFGDQHYVGLQERLEKLGIYNVSTQKLRECVYSVAIANAIDTAQVWLDGLEWDGVPRIERFFVDYFGADESAYVLEVGKYIWSALAGRVLVPGVQADMVPVLVGKQGVRKSTGIVAMAPAREFFSEFIFGDNETESARKMRGCLVGELAELRGLRSKEKEHIKAWLTRTHEEVRKLYKEFTTTFPRRHMFIGSTNDEKFLDEDPSGQRRWLPIRVGEGRVERICEDRDQLWAEGAALFAENGGIWFAGAELLAREIHAEFIEADAWEGLIMEWIDGMDGSGMLPEYLTTEDICEKALDIPKSARHSGTNRRVGTVLRKHGWVHEVRRVSGGLKGKKVPKNVWVKKEVLP